MKKLGLILVFLLTQLGGAIASDFKNHHGHDHRHCQSLLQHSSVITPGDIRITNSGQDLDLQPNLQEAARIMYHELAPKVGITIPQMTITSLSASDMAALSSTAGHPMPHWTDGRKVANGAKGAAGIYEFVVPGQRVHHQFVRDTNNFHDTLIVYAHVGGHYDFAEHSILFKSRDPDQIRYSYELSQLMSRNYTLYGKTEVSEFYQFLLTMAHAQDLSRGSFDPPEFFDPTAMGRQSVVTRPKQGFISGESEIQYANLIHPRRPSESELQAFVRNLPSTIEPWKREMAEVFEKNNRVVPAYLNTKVLNEGWATILEYILLAHSPWNSSADAVKFGQLNAGVNRPSLSNPYWLGSQAWLQVRERFLERPEIKNLSPIEQDRLFVEEAHRIIEQSSDYSFINYALDKNWVEKHNLLLYRTVDRAPGEKTNMAISRDPKRVVRWIANKIANHDLHFPKIEIKDFNSRAEGVVLLNHKPVFGVPLDRSTVAKALFVRAKLLERPVAIETIGSRLWEKPRPPERRVPGKPVAPPPYHPLDTYPIRITVSPKGEVKVESEVNAESLQALYQQTVDAYRFDISLSLEPGRVHAELERMNQIKVKFANFFETEQNSNTTVANLMSHAPTAADAVLDYYQMRDLRLYRGLKLAAQGKWPIKFTGGGKKVKLKVFPEIPEFGLDQRVLSGRQRHLRPTEPDSRLSQMSKFEHEHEQMQDEDLEIGTGPYLPGDKWKEKEDPSGNGKGDEGEGEESEEPGEPGGSNGGDPTEMEVPVELFGEVLAEEIELRNLRKTKGENNITEDVRLGGEHRPEGIILWDRTIHEIYALGVALAKKAGKDPRKMTRNEIVSLGMRHYTPAEHVVASRDEVPQPDIDAVILWIADTSGSMSVEHQKVQRQMVANERAVLRKFYPHLKEKFIIYDTTAKEVTEREFFSQHMGGGTDAQAAFQLGQKILEEQFPRSRYNRFVQTFSDGDDFSNGASAKEAEKLGELCEYFAYGHIAPNGDHRAPLQQNNLSKEMEVLSQSNQEKIGFAILTHDYASIIDGLRAFYGKQKPTR